MPPRYNWNIVESGVKYYNPKNQHGLCKILTIKKDNKKNKQYKYMCNITKVIYYLCEIKETENG